MRIDLFGETASFDIAGKSAYPSMCGTIMSIVVYAAILCYSSKQYNVMVGYEDTTHSTTLKKDGLDKTVDITYD